MSVAKYDIFLSYAERDKEGAHRLRDALVSEGLTVWLGEERKLSYDDVTKIFKAALSQSKALLAYFSREYPKSRECQWELTQAYLAGEKVSQASEAKTLSRIIIVNPERSGKHLFPEEFKKAFSAQLPKTASAERYKKLAAMIGKQIAEITDPIGEIINLDKPAGHGRDGVYHPSFVGQVKDIWDIHYALRNGNAVLLTGAKDEPHGLLGIGKTLLSEEYAMRFGAAYPGGIYWISASAPPPRIPEDELERKLKDLALELDMPIRESLSLIELRQELHTRVKNSASPSLWIVDDMPEDMDHEKLKLWFAPTRSAKTLITTRSREYAQLPSIHLGVPDLDEARCILGKGCEYVHGKEKEAGKIIRSLGHHPLALDMAASIMLKEGVDVFSEGLRKKGKDVKKLADELSDELPRRSAPGISATLLHAVGMSDENGRDYLRLASVLAPIPFPSEIARDVIARIDGLTGTDAESKITHAAEQLSSLSLAVRADRSMMQVHPLIVHTIRFYDTLKEKEDRRSSIRICAIKVLRYLISCKANDPGLHKEIISSVTHARELVTKVSMADEAYLAGWIGRYDYLRGSYHSAARLHRRELEFFISTLGGDHLDTLASMNNLALALTAMADYEEALKIQHRALDITKNTYGEEHPETLTSMNNLALTYWTILDLKKAREIQEKVLLITKRVRGSKHLDTIISAWNLFLTLDRLEDFGSAKELLEKDLLWLLDEDASALSPHALIIRKYVSEVARVYEQRGAETEKEKGKHAV